ncbi:histidine kinase [Gilvimarinus agarilyticus]|uniref:histidine kinase n=1 Tax=unclassified Gilvimarinus TaxID=2642066 RepID=UPI001C09E9A6|nr:MULTISPECIES: histidine kinase [unclassified Gilvimarinus]MBU2887868.1 histidine kinase [Gilvimarinus agarilyticus]MDO6572506.1 histidine kinase [Gilvimarinus sp. 2_MG-2023]MDO6746646.1 histidine kinase [Gilvimarinus sp. 1_MG-2023]
MNEDVKKLIHDARNPLNNISVNAELGKLTLETINDKEKAMAIFDTIVNECKRCSQSLDVLSSYLKDSKSSPDE